ncbi:MAG TPA: helix-turn-helix transcriptional regulator [Devosia sp.]|nr:helix-turn-helix transcriptional regulator [Devosia sp.]
MTLTSGDRERPYDPEYGLARARDAAFDAVTRLWRRRREQGMKQKDLAAIMDKRESWVSKQLRGPGNWTMKVFGQLVDALDGEIEIRVYGREEIEQGAANYDAYSGYEPVLRSADGPRNSSSSGTVFVTTDRSHTGTTA